MKSIRTILLVEDDPAIADVLSAVFEIDFGMTVVRAHDVGTATAVLEGPHRPDIALIDYWLSGEMGLNIAETAAVNSVPFVFLTGDHLIASVLEECLIPVIRKPCSIDPMIAQIGAVIQQHNSESGVMIQRLREFRKLITTREF